MTDDLISRQEAIAYSISGMTREIDGDKWIRVSEVRESIKTMPSAQPGRLTDDDFEAIRIHLNAFKEDLCNQGRWKEAEDYERLIDRFMSFASAQQWIPCSERYPDMDERVLVYTVAHDYHVWDCMSNRADNYFWEDDEGLYHDKYEADLWMPLPELTIRAERKE